LPFTRMNMQRLLPRLREMTTESEIIFAEEALWQTEVRT
jgi:hypothetical protein